VELKELIAQIPDFAHKKHVDKIRIFAWWLHTHKAQEAFTGSDVNKCYRDLNLEPPSSITSFLASLIARKPKQVLRCKGGYCLERRVRDKYDEELGQRAATLHVHKLLKELPDKIPNLAERAYLEEALICFKYKAFRAAIVMTWNLAYDHLCQIVLKSHLTSFNAQLAKSFPKENIITKRDDFTEIKEYQVLQVCKSANIMTGSVYKITKEKLDRRNVAAHPSGVTILDATAGHTCRALVARNRSTALNPTRRIRLCFLHTCTPSIRRRRCTRLGIND
jgi:hypothetical protein